MLTRLCAGILSDEQLIHQALPTLRCGHESGGYLHARGIINGELIENGNPDYLRQAIRTSFTTLGGEKSIGLWMYHRIDPNYPLEQSLKPAKETLSE
jgi:aryl-alcohol dehydrogenase-like predicted oxidoreductase